MACFSGYLEQNCPLNHKSNVYCYRVELVVTVIKLSDCLASCRFRWRYKIL